MQIHLPPFVLLAVLPAVLLAGCSAEASVATRQAATVSPTATASVVDPVIPALTIVAHRMSATEKLRYDREQSLRVGSTDLR